MSKLIEYSLSELVSKLQSQEITSRELTEAYIDEIESRNEDLNVFLTTTFDRAREMADASDSRIKAGQALSDLDGIPISLKDVVCTKGITTTAASNILKNFTPPYNATVWDKLESAGCVLLGKVNTDEFTMGGSTESSAFGVTKNPIDPTCVPGGSSGGSAASVAAHFCAGSIGTDTGGSIRQPASFCGVSGLKVSYGRVSRWGCMPMASSLDTVGPIAKTPEDCARMLQIIAGKDPKDSTTPEQAVPDYLKNLGDSISGMTFGIPKEYFTDGINPEVVSIIDSTKAIIENLGGKVVDISLPHTKYAISAYYIIAPSEISANMSRYDGIRFGHLGTEKESLEEIYSSTREEGLGDEVKRRILIGTYALSAGYYDAYYRKAQKVRTLIKQDFDNAFEKVDAILCPAAPTPAFKIGKNDGDPLLAYLEDAFTIPASLAGICGISFPVGFSKDKLPIGPQILCPAYTEERALQIGNQIYNAVHNP